MLEPGDWQTTSGDLCELLGVEHKQLTRWVRLGMPKLGRARWDMRECVQWVVQWVGDRAPSTELDAARKALLESQERKISLEIDRLEGAVYDSEVVHTCLMAVVSTVYRAHAAIPAQAVNLVGLDEQTIRDELEAQCETIGEAIAIEFGAFSLDQIAREAVQSAAEKTKRAAKLGRRKSNTSARGARPRKMAK